MKNRPEIIARQFLSFLKKKKLFLLYLPSVLFSGNLELSNHAPTAEEYVAVRSAAGMKERSISSAEKGIRNSLFWVTVRDRDILIGMGRVVGDGGTVAQVTDIAIHPSYQKKGYGKLIFEQIQDYILREIPDDAFVCLFTEKNQGAFYQKYGYQYSEMQWPGMYWPCADRRKFKQMRESPSS